MSEALEYALTSVYCDPILAQQDEY